MQRTPLQTGIRLVPAALQQERFAEQAPREGLCTACPVGGRQVQRSAGVVLHAVGQSIPVEVVLPDAAVDLRHGGQPRVRLDPDLEPLDLGVNSLPPGAPDVQHDGQRLVRECQGVGGAARPRHPQCGLGGVLCRHVSAGLTEPGGFDGETSCQFVAGGLRCQRLGGVQVPRGRLWMLVGEPCLGRLPVQPRRVRRRSGRPRRPHRVLEGDRSARGVPESSRRSPTCSQSSVSRSAPRCLPHPDLLVQTLARRCRVCAEFVAEGDAQLLVLAQRLLSSAASACSRIRPARAFSCTGSRATARRSAAVARSRSARASSSRAHSTSSATKSARSVSRRTSAQSSYRSSGSRSPP